MKIAVVRIPATKLVAKIHLLKGRVSSRVVTSLPHLPLRGFSANAPDKHAFPHFTALQTAWVRSFQGGQAVMGGNM